MLVQSVKELVGLTVCTGLKTTNACNSIRIRGPVAMLSSRRSAGVELREINRTGDKAHK